MKESKGEFRSKVYTQTNFIDPLTIDYFAGGGGASTGLGFALGRLVADDTKDKGARAVQSRV